MAIRISLSTRRLGRPSHFSILYFLSDHSSHRQNPISCVDDPERLHYFTTLANLGTPIVSSPIRNTSTKSALSWRAIDGLRCYNMSLASISSSPGTAEGGEYRPSEGGGASKPPKAASSWVESYLPESVQPYALLARLDKPIGTWLLAWPSMCMQVNSALLLMLYCTNIQ